LIPVNKGVVNTISIGIADNVDSSGDSALLLAGLSILAVPEPSTMALLIAALTGISRFSMST